MAGLPAEIRAVFFDVVGTVLFPEPSAPAIYAEVARRNGLDATVAEIRSRFIASFAREEEIDRASGWITSEAREEERWRNIVAATFPELPCPEPCFQELYHHFAQPGSWQVGSDVEAVIQSLLGRGIVVGLGSNYDRRLWPVVAGFPALRSLLDRTIISSVVGCRKPAPEFFVNIVRAAGCSPSEVLFVGDDLANDYEGALAAGLQARLLDPSRRHPAVERIERLGELFE